MSLKIWQRILDSTRASGRRERNRRRSTTCTAATRCQPRLESLEDRRLLAAGALDPTFGGDGIVTTVIETRAQASDLAILPDGRLVAVGKTYTAASSGQELDAALARYSSNGALDMTFGGDGIVTTGFKRGSDDWFNAVVVQADGKIIAGGNFLARYNVDGSLDASFGGVKAKGKFVPAAAGVIDMVL